jgi:hypothetical protein
MDLASSSGSTQSESDIILGISYCAAAVIAFFLARWIRDDIVNIFSTRRFVVPREKLIVYSMLALPFGFIIPGVLLILVNFKLSHPEFMPSHAEAYPESMPGFVMLPVATQEGEAPGGEDIDVPGEVPSELAPLGFETVPVSSEEAQPAPEFMEELGPEDYPPPAVAAPQAPPAAIIEEIPDEEIPEVVAQIAAPPQVAPPVAQPAVVEALVEEIPADEGEGDFELMIEEVPPGSEDDEEKPKDTKEAHDQLMAKLLGK